MNIDRDRDHHCDCDRGRNSFFWVKSEKNQIFSPFLVQIRKLPIRNHAKVCIWCTLSSFFAFKIITKICRFALDCSKFHFETGEKGETLAGENFACKSMQNCAVFILFLEFDLQTEQSHLKEVLSFALR